MPTVPVADLFLVVGEFVALFAVTWVVWFALVTVYQVFTRRHRPLESFGEGAMQVRPGSPRPRG